MTTDTTWYPIPGYSRYEINRDGNVRISINSSIPEERGELMRLRTFVPDKSKPDEITETYLLKSDEEGFKVMRKSELLDSAF